MAESDRDLLIEVRTAVKAMHIELLGGEGREGRIPKIEKVQDDHAAKISSASGAVSAVIWILGGIGILFVTLAGVVFAHILGGK